MHHARRSLILLALVFAGAFLLVWQRSEYSPSSHPVLLSGQICDAHGPVAGARVRLQGTPASTLSDAQGCFQLSSASLHGPRLTAWKEGYFICSADAGSAPLVLRLAPLPKVDNEDYQWVSPHPDENKPHNCGNCHAEIHREWNASGHARAVTNRHFANLYDGSDGHGRPGRGWSLLTEHPDGAGVCTSCHAPSVGFSDPAYYDLRKATGAARAGVHCDYCHKVAAVENVEFGLTHGRFGLKLLRPQTGQLALGPLDDVQRGEDTYAAVYRESRYCATCHEGVVFGVHVYSTYSEWLASKARQDGKQCQNCHMTPTGAMTNFAPGHGGVERDPRSLGNHRFFAGSRQVMLRHSLKFKVNGRAESDGTRVDIVITPENVGHRVPTGFSDRNLLLVVEAFAKDGARLAPNAATPLLPQLAGKALANLPGKLFAKQLSDFDGGAPVPFWRANPDMTDTRLLPDVAALSSYQFSGKADRVRVRLLHRRFWQELADSKAWPDNEISVLDRTFSLSPAQNLAWSGH